MICQRSTGPGLPQLRGPERRRLDAAHPARHGHGLVAMGDVERCFGDVVVADAGAVHEGFVGEVHQVVDHEPVVALHVDGLAVAGPLRIVVPVHVRHQRGIGQRRIAHPQPDEAMPLDHGIGAHVGRILLHIGRQSQRRRGRDIAESDIGEIRPLRQIDLQHHVQHRTRCIDREPTHHTGLQARDIKPQ